MKFIDNSIEIKEKIDELTTQFLYEAKDCIANQASKLSPVDQGALRASFQTDSFVDESENTAYVGSSLEYAIYQENGTGEYALQGNGRKGGWCYLDERTGKYVFTRGNPPKRMLYKAFMFKSEEVIKRGKELFKKL